MGPTKKDFRVFVIKSLFFYFILAVIVISSIVIGVLTFVGSINKKAYIKKDKIQYDLSLAIKNGCDLRTIKQLYKSRNFITSNFFGINDKDNNYEIDIPLSEILEDIRASQYLSKDKKLDTSFISTLNRLTLEYAQTNPFDKLENNQRDYFENIRIKTSSNYGIIQNDVNKIVDELQSKNSLVNQYLKDSTTSFWISILALGLSLIIGLFQIYLNRSNKIYNLMLSANKNAANNTEV